MASGGQKKVEFSVGNGMMQRSQSDSKLYHEEGRLSSNDLFGSTSSVHGAYNTTPTAEVHTRFNDGEKVHTISQKRDLAYVAHVVLLHMSEAD